MFGANPFGWEYFGQGYAGTTANVSAATETDLAQAVSSHKVKTIGQIVETQDHPIYGEDAYGGGPYGGGPYSGYGVFQPEKTKTPGQALETDSVTALTYAATKRVVVSWAEVALPVGVMSDEVNPASETDLAQALTRVKGHILGRAYEQGPLTPGSTTIPGEIFPLADSGALSIDATPSFIVGQATETDFAQAILVNTAIGQAVETNEAQAIAEIKHATLGQATETDAAQALGGGNLREAIVSWAEVSMPRGAPLTSIGQAQETELAQAVTVSQAQPPRIAAAGLIFMWGDLEAVGQTVVLGQAQETELSQTVSVHKTLALGQASETDTAQAVASFRFFPIGQAEETDTAQAVTAVGGGVPIQFGQTAETDLAQPVIWKIVRLVGQIEEVDVALDVIVIGGFTLGYEDCDDLNLIPEADFLALYPSALTYPSSVTYPSEGADQLANPLPEGSDALVLVPA